METESGARIDVDKSRNLVLIRGTAETREKASDLIRQKLTDGNFEELRGDHVVSQKNEPRTAVFGIFDFLPEDLATKNYNKEKRVAKQMAFKLMQSQSTEAGVNEELTNGSLKHSNHSNVSKEGDIVQIPSPIAHNPIATPMPPISTPIIAKDDEEFNFFGSFPPGMSPPSHRKVDLPQLSSLSVQQSPPEPLKDVPPSQSHNKHVNVALCPEEPPTSATGPPELDANAAFLLNLLNAGKPSAESKHPEETPQGLQGVNSKGRPNPMPSSVPPPGLSRTPSDDGYGKKVAAPTNQGAGINYSKAVSRQTSSSDKYFKSKSGFSVRL